MGQILRWISAPTGLKCYDDAQTGKLPIRRTSIRCHWPRSKRNHSGNPLKIRPQTVQTNRTTSGFLSIRRGFLAALAPVIKKHHSHRELLLSPASVQLILLHAEVSLNVGDFPAATRWLARQENMVATAPVHWANRAILYGRCNKFKKSDIA